MTILVFADIVGRIGREALAQILPKWKTEFTPTLTLANIENLAHGGGITPRTVAKLIELGVDVMTGGNHMWDNPAYMEVFANKDLAGHIVRPLNDVGVKPGVGALELEKDGRRFTILNVMGQTFFKNAYPSPFDALDQALTKADPDSIILLDVHAETTSEKALISRYADGRVSAVWGSHTHVPTADERILPGGTAFMTDVGLTGAHNESIGIEYEKALTLVKDGVKTHLAPPYSGPAEVNAALLFFKSGNRLPASIKRLREIVTVLPN